MASSHGNLPTELSSFIGREAEIRRLIELQPKAPLLSLVGPGGVGKTRLALRVASALSATYLDGVWLVDVSSLADADLVAPTVADVLGVREAVGRPALHMLGDRLRDRHLLLLLDNCEHLIGACHALAAALVPACPQLRIMATSREPLGAPDERVWNVSPLTLPPSPDAPPDRPEESEALDLLVDRARARMPAFAVTPQNVRELVAICHSVDGLPLALELVGTWLPSLALSDIVARLQTGLALRLSGSRSAPPRHRSLAATLDWSHDMLSPTEQMLFRRLAVFPGGWSAESAEAVCAADPLRSASVPALLERLATASLIVREAASESERFRLLYTVRDYAMERLAAAGEGEQIRGRHLDYIVRLAEEMPPEALDAAHAAVLVREQANVRAALTWSVQHGDADAGLRLATATFTLWYFTGHYAEGRIWMERLLALGDAAPTATRARALLFVGQMLLWNGQYDRADDALQDALEQHRARADRTGAALSLTLLGNVALWRGNLARAADLYAEAIPLLHSVGNRGECVALFQAALAALELGHPEQARVLAAQCETRGRAWNHPVAVASALSVQGAIAGRTGDAELAVRLLEASLDEHRRTSHQQGIVISLTELGHVQLDQARVEQARVAFAEAMRTVCLSGERNRVPPTLEGLARCLARSHPEIALRIGAAADAQRQSLAAAPWPSDVQRSAWQAAARRRLGPRAAAAAWDAGRHLSPDDALDLVSTAQREAEPPAAILTARERDVTKLLVRGFSNRQIANTLHISVATVRTHLDHILAKLELHTRVEVAVWATQGGLITARTSEPDAD